MCWLVLTVNLTKSRLSWAPEPWGLPLVGGGVKWCDLDCVTEWGRCAPVWEVAFLDWAQECVKRREGADRLGMHSLFSLPDYPNDRCWGRVTAAPPPAPPAGLAAVTSPL